MADRHRGGARDVLARNQAFYRAFSRRDLAAMEALWAADAPVACIHPGWNALRGRELVIASWRSILGSDDSPDVVCGNATAHVLGESALVICEEQVADALLIATNVFVREGGEWKLAHHQAAPIAADSSDMARMRDDDDDEDQTLN
jgi:hypothetical protein